MSIEQTLILVKHDGVLRGLTGEIISRFEKTGLKPVALKMVWPSDEKAKDHYPLDEEWAKGIFTKTKASYDKDNKPFPYKDHLEIGNQIQSWLHDFLKEGPIVAIIFEGPHSVELGRKLVGSTEPLQAAPGSIRGDFASIESYAIADKKQRVLRNLVHASDTIENAQREISVWFSKEEIHSYEKDLDKHF
jgi:nucleoside-diphosphate kinase